MDPASAAAVASTPSIKGGILMDSFDAKIVQYQCAISKLQLLATHVRATSIKVRADSQLVPLIHNIVILAGPWMSVHDTLRKRLEQVSRLQRLSDIKRVMPPVYTAIVSFDADEGNELHAPDYTACPAENYPTLLDNLLGIVENALAIYQAKLKQSIVERDANRRPDANHRPIPLNMDSFKDILQPLEVLCLSKLVVTRSDIPQSRFKIIPIILDSISKTLDNIQKYNTELAVYKKKTTEAILKRLPSWTHTIHRIFACFVKLGELYSILRKLGRDLYIPSSDDLHNPKLLYNNVKLEVSLNSCDDYFKSTRKNEQIVFILSRATRQGSIFHLKRDTVLSLILPLDQSTTLTRTMIDVLAEFLKNWEAVDGKEKRTKVKLEAEKSKEKSSSEKVVVSPNATKRLSVLFNPEKEKLSHEAIAKQQRDRERTVLEGRAIKEKVERERKATEDIKSKRRIEERERQLRDELTKDRSPGVSRSGSLIANTRQRSGSSASASSIPNASTRKRSNSNASTTSNSSNSSMLNSMRNNSLTNSSRPSQRSPSALSRSPSLQIRRPTSVYMSSPAFDIRSELRRQEKAAAAAAGAAGALGAGGLGLPTPNISLKRTPSLPTGRAASNAAHVAAAAGAAALNQERHSSLKASMEARYRHVSPPKHLPVPERSRPDPSPKRSPSPARNNSEHYGLPDISELSVLEGILKTPPRRSPKPKVATSGSTPQFEITNASIILTPNTTSPDAEAEDSSRQETPSKPQTSSHEHHKSRTLDPLAAPELSATTETSADSSVSTASSDDGKTIQEVSEQPKKIVKKVRFSCLPDDDEKEDLKPKRKGWINPPRLPLIRTSPKSRTSLSYAAQALVQQERMTFSSIRRGELDVGTGKIVYPEKNTRIMSTLTSGGATQNATQKGKWRIGGKLKDRFA